MSDSSCAGLPWLTDILLQHTEPLREESLACCGQARRNRLCVRKEMMMLPYPTSVSVPPVNMIPAQGNGRRFARRKRCLVATLTDVIDAGLNTGKHVQGSYARAFERLIEERWQVAAAVAVNSGSAALRLAFEALHIEAGREVLVPALTFISTAYAVHDAGLVPVFVDIDPHTFTIDPAAVDTAISEKTAT